MASVVESSHFPLGVLFNAPFFANASWISVMRCGVGVICPRWRPALLERLPDFLAPDFVLLDFATPDFPAPGKVFTGVFPEATAFAVAEFFALEWFAAGTRAAAEDLAPAEVFTP